VSNANTKPFPKFADYPQTEEGWNRYDSDWVSRRHMTSSIAEIPKEVLEEHWAAMSLGRAKGWEEWE
jgi:hypothetical protein